MSKVVFIHLFNDRSGSPKVLSQVIKILRNKNVITDRIKRQTMIISILIRLSAFIINAPIPFGIAIISAAIITRQDIPASSLIPVNILPSARGNTIFKRIVNFDPPSN